MAEIFPLQHFYDAVSAQFATDSTDALLRFGWTAQYRQISGVGSERVVIWVPGDDKGKPSPDMADMGRMGGPVGSDTQQNLTTHVRSLASLYELGTVYCHARDVMMPESELNQYTEARLLWNAWYRAMYLVGHGFFKVKNVSWVRRMKSTRHLGASIRTVFEIGSPVADKPLGSDFPTVSGPTGDASGFDFEVISLDHSEQLTKTPV